MRVLTQEERTEKVAQSLVREVMCFSLYSFAEVACDIARDIVGGILSPRNQKSLIRPIDEYDDKVKALCLKIQSNIYSFYDTYADLVSRLQWSYDSDLFDGLASANEAVMEVMKPNLEKLTKAIDKEMAVYRPIDPHLFSAINKALYLSSLFLRYRKTFSDELKGDKVIVAFRSLKMDSMLHDLANMLEMKDRNGKTLRYLYESSEVHLWSTFGNRRCYKGIDVRSTRTIDIRKHFAKEALDRATFELIREAFRLKNVDRFSAPLHENTKYSGFFKNEFFFQCMGTYEQYAITSNMLAGNISKAYDLMGRLREMFPEKDIIVSYQNVNGRSDFDGCFLDAAEAAKETNDGEDAIRHILDKNTGFKAGIQALVFINSRTYFRMDLVEEFIGEKIKRLKTA